MILLGRVEQHVRDYSNIYPGYNVFKDKVFKVRASRCLRFRGVWPLRFVRLKKASNKLDSKNIIMKESYNFIVRDWKIWSFSQKGINALNSYELLSKLNVW